MAAPEPEPLPLMPSHPPPSVSKAFKQTKKNYSLFEFITATVSGNYLPQVVCRGMPAGSPSFPSLILEPWSHGR